MSDAKKYPTRMHKVLGVETGERFKIEKVPDEFFLNHEGRMIVVTAGRMFNSSGDILTYAINHGIIRKPRLTHEQVEQLKALVTLGYRWLVEERNGVTVAVNHEVKKGEVKWLLIKPRDLDDVVCDVHQSLSIKGLVSWSDPEPLDIVATLKAAGVEVEGCE